jgi:NADPH-dependent 2,4-dienoyl-CoA reductase/sulfur reductase-like enzyme
MMHAMHAPDPTAITGKKLAIAAHWPCVVIGAGNSGIAAATEAARAGAKVLLVDEHPSPPGLLGLDIPYLFGGRLDASVQNAGRMLETVLAARPGLEAAMDSGVEVALGTCVWGAFARGPASRALPAPILGLSDDSRAWLVSAERIVVAAGTRDLALPFPNWEVPGVMGARGFIAAVSLYRAFTGQRIAVLGQGAAADAVLRTAAEHGITVAVHQKTPSHVSAGGRLEVDGVEIAGALHACDTIVLAIDAVPNVEIFDLLGVKLEFDGTRGGFVPGALPPWLVAVGSCAGRAEAHDRIAARDAWLLALDSERPEVCRCEGVTMNDLLGLAPPRYLDDTRAGSLTNLGPLNQDQVKRLTRAGMGACQGRRCRDTVHALLSREAARDGGARPPMASYRAPLRPLSLAALASLPEDAAVRNNWTGWFGIPAQWLPHWEPVPDNPEFIGGRLTDWSIAGGDSHK